MRGSLHLHHAGELEVHRGNFGFDNLHHISPLQPAYHNTPIKGRVICRSWFRGISGAKPHPSFSPLIHNSQTWVFPVETIIIRGARFAVTPCICRQERQLAGEGCGKPLETCLSLDGAADGAIRQGRGRAITLEEALHILQSANCAGLVLQPGNSKDAQYFCCCCGDCCGVLRNVKRHPQPGRLISSAFYAVSAAALCSGCGECLERCQMDAISLAEGWAAVDRERCIGCGLCVTTCPSGALRLERKPAAELPHVPDNSLMMYLQLARARGVLGPSEIARTALQSGIDRLRAK